MAIALRKIQTQSTTSRASSVVSAPARSARFTRFSHGSTPSTSAPSAPQAIDVREGKEKTCFHIWHDEWSNGNAIPRRLQDHKIRNRPPASRPGKKRRRRTVEGAAGESEGSGGATSDVAPGSDDGLADDEAQESTVERRTQSSETIL
ncbi:hypothetical protein PF005_g33318 [Phytophthora fragariae]|uniref:Uncharacterized protein n=1 Tax=Phytophthora fragariae TaxID=53985 RepID=A0A6A3UXB5_9STRA|nr:hypothetical protein PF011_g32203 [Phytophthora fragariae]KAE9156190.1 hypothetical protein PF005_g33318 [Phytophthora fragariae]